MDAERSATPPVAAFCAVSMKAKTLSGGTPAAEAVVEATAIASSVETPNSLA